MREAIKTFNRLRIGTRQERIERAAKKHNVCPIRLLDKVIDIALSDAWDVGMGRK